MSESIPANNSSASADDTSRGEFGAYRDKHDSHDKPALEVKHRVLLMGAVMTVTIMQFLDVTIANVALPHMQSSLGATLDTVSWVLTSFIIAGVLVTPIVGWLSDNFGSRAVFIGAVAGFLLASMLCGMATSIVQMVVFRCLQGVCAAILGPMAQTILLDVNPPSKQPGALSAWGLAVMVAPIVGPVLGGFLTDALSWRWVFYINIPLGIPALIILVWLLPSRPIERRRLDSFGFFFLATGLAALQLMLDRGQHLDWLGSREILIELIVMLSAFWIYAVHAMTAEKPLFPNAIFKDRNFSGALGSMFVIGVANVAISAVLPTMFQNVYGYTAFDTGLLLLPRAMGVLTTMLIGARIMKKIDLRYLVAAGYFIAGAALWRMSTWSLDIDRWPIIVTGFVQGLGIGCIFMPMNIVAVSTLDPQHRPNGVSIINLVRNIGGSAGISIVVTLLARNVQVSHADMAAHVTTFNAPAADTIATSQLFGGNGTAALQMIDAEINRQALMIAYIDNFRAMAIFIICVAFSLFLLKPMRLANGQRTPVAD